MMAVCLFKTMYRGRCSDLTTPGKMSHGASFMLFFFIFLQLRMLVLVVVTAHSLNDSYHRNNTLLKSNKYYSHKVSTFTHLLTLLTCSSNNIIFYLLIRHFFTLKNSIFKVTSKMLSDKRWRITTAVFPHKRKVAESQQ